MGFRQEIDEELDREEHDARLREAVKLVADKVGLKIESDDHIDAWGDRRRYEW